MQLEVLDLVVDVNSVLLVLHKHQEIYLYKCVRNILYPTVSAPKHESTRSNILVMCMYTTGSVCVLDQ